MGESKDQISLSTFQECVSVFNDYFSYLKQVYNEDLTSMYSRSEGYPPSVGFNGKMGVLLSPERLGRHEKYKEEIQQKELEMENMVTEMRAAKAKAKQIYLAKRKIKLEIKKIKKNLEHSEAKNSLDFDTFFKQVENGTLDQYRYGALICFVRQVQSDYDLEAIFKKDRLEEWIPFTVVDGNITFTGLRLIRPPTAALRFFWKKLGALTYYLYDETKDREYEQDKAKRHQAIFKANRLRF